MNHQNSDIKKARFYLEQHELDDCVDLLKKLCENHAAFRNRLSLIQANRESLRAEKLTLYPRELEVRKNQILTDMISLLHDLEEEDQKNNSFTPKIEEKMTEEKQTWAEIGMNFLTKNPIWLIFAIIVVVIVGCFYYFGIPITFTEKAKEKATTKEFTLRGILKDEKGENFLSGVKVTIENNAIQSEPTGSDGRFSQTIKGANPLTELQLHYDYPNCEKGSYKIQLERDCRKLEENENTIYELSKPILLPCKKKDNTIIEPKPSFKPSSVPPPPANTVVKEGGGKRAEKKYHTITINYKWRNDLNNTKSGDLLIKILSESGKPIREIRAEPFKTTVNQLEEGTYTIVFFEKSTEKVLAKRENINVSSDNPIEF